MTRWIALILFSLGVLHASGIALPSSTGDSCATLCGSHDTPQQVIVPPSCCPSQSTEAQDIETQSIKALDEDSQSNDYCPMSSGPCTCGLNPANDHTPDEPMPAPQRERQTLQMVRGPPLTIHLITTDTPKRLIPVALTGSIRSGYSHNQAQAFLGVWRR